MIYLLLNKYTSSTAACNGSLVHCPRTSLHGLERGAVASLSQDAPRRQLSDQRRACRLQLLRVLAFQRQDDAGTIAATLNLHNIAPPSQTCCPISVDPETQMRARSTACYLARDAEDKLGDC